MAGFEYELSPLVCFRSGVMSHPVQLTFGSGIQWHRLHFDVSATMHQHLGWFPRFPFSIIKDNGHPVAMWIMKRLCIWLLLAPLAAGSQITDSLTGELPPEGEYLVEELSGIYDEGIDAADIASESSLTSFRRIDLNNTEPLLLAEELRLSPAQTENLAKYLREYGSAADHLRTEGDPRLRQCDHPQNRSGDHPAAKGKQDVVPTGCLIKADTWNTADTIQPDA